MKVQCGYESVVWLMVTNTPEGHLLRSSAWRRCGSHNGKLEAVGFVSHEKSALTYQTARCHISTRYFMDNMTIHIVTNFL
jgi:hypothetical protein